MKTKSKIGKERYFIDRRVWKIDTTKKEICGRVLPCFPELGVPGEKCPDDIYGVWDCFELIKRC